MRRLATGQECQMEYLVLVAALVCLAAMLKLQYGRHPASAGLGEDDDDF